ncbi:hypothetical protein PPACK8108_LOCUS14110 [Phakopsora pachyrhizi]|uniref:Uncharacterized protein n=1 Tax=Phakopsora pachyrhizi TaxID=170000 RepID=A0AAV0B5R4_PHAPC|nr:hypothetical protein PPACK8108_LOCUS14110 [Phakopsora pachyrhizi]
MLILTYLIIFLFGSLFSFPMNSYRKRSLCIAKFTPKELEPLGEIPRTNNPYSLSRTESKFASNNYLHEFQNIDDSPEEFFHMSFEEPEKETKSQGSLSNYRRASPKKPKIAGGLSQLFNEKEVKPGTGVKPRNYLIKNLEKMQGATAGEKIEHFFQRPTVYDST